MKTSFNKINTLLNKDYIQQIIFDSQLKNYVNINQYTINQINEYFEKSINIIENKPKLILKLIEESTTHYETKYHKENLITHLYCVGWICCLFANKFNLMPEYAFQLGFFHDIGKPWAKKTIQTKKKIISNSKGHAQIGENICQELKLDKKICWCVSNHMCSCCHQNDSSVHWNYINSLQLISFDKNIVLGDKNKLFEYANSLACLMIGDDLGRLGEIEKNYFEIISHSEKWLHWFKQQNDSLENPLKQSVKMLSSLHPDNSIIIQIYGHSGFGKSTMVKELISKLDELEITWDYAERDKSYYNIYSLFNDVDIEETIKTCDYKVVYEYIQLNELKKNVQQDWIEQLNRTLDSDSKVKIIDSVQLMYPNIWNSTLNSLNNDALAIHKSSLKIGYYGFPLSEYGIDYKPKTGSYQLIPRENNDAFTRPNINSEFDKLQKFDPNIIDVGYGRIEPITNTIINFNYWSKLYIPEKQIHLFDILKSADKNQLTSNYIQEYIINQFPPGIIQCNEEYNYLSSKIIRFTYRDGMQIFNGPSRDYRGETILFDSNKQEFFIGRLCLPVFPDYSNLRKDPSIQEIIKNNKCMQYHITPKFDGSLFVLALIKINSPQFEIISKLLHLINPNSYYSNELGIWCFGSKGCMFAKNQFNDYGVLSSILNSIKSSYNTIENFISKVSDEVKLNSFYDTYQNISLCFEAIDAIPHSLLTVDYGKAFCPFLCWIVWDGEKKKIILPNNIIYLAPIAEITTFDSWEKVIEFKNTAHSRLLEGSLIDEPEGYVVWFGDTNLGVKLKHQEYYAAHKPYSKKNLELSKKIEFDSEYSKLKTRLIKFKPKPKIIDIIDKNLDNIINLFLHNYNYLNTKKNWAIRWKDDNLLKQLEKEFEIIETKITVFYPQFKSFMKNRVFSSAIDYFDKREEWKNYFCLKYLKIN